MAEALIKGLLDSKNAGAENITVSDIRDERLEHLKARYKVETGRNNVEIAKESDILVVAVKPQDVPIVLEEIRRYVRNRLLVVSIAAGVKISTIMGYVSAKIVRAMPNTCAQVGQAITALSFDPKVEKEDIDLAVSLFSSVGETVIVDETMMDAVTAVSGSGPAYIFLVIESMIQAGVEAGLSFENSRTLVLQTVKGAAELAIITGEHPVTLKERITSPKGTTAAALHELEKNNVRGAFLDAVAAAVKRSKELG